MARIESFLNSLRNKREMIQTPRASFSKDGKDKRARGGVLGKRSFTLSDNFYKFPVAWFRRKRKRDTYKLTRSIFPHYTATWFRILSDVTEPSIYVTRHNICEIATLPVYANVSVKLSNVLYRGRIRNDGRREPCIKFPTNPSFISEFRSHLVERKERKADRSRSIK